MRTMALGAVLHPLRQPARRMKPVCPGEDWSGWVGGLSSLPRRDVPALKLIAKGNKF